MNRKDRRAAGIKSASGASRRHALVLSGAAPSEIGSKPLAAVLAAVGTVADVDGKLPGPSFLPDLHLHFVFGGKQVCARLVPSDGETPAGVVQGEEDPDVCTDGVCGSTGGRRPMRRTMWFVIFKSPDGLDGQPALVQGGRRFKAVRRVAALCPRGWKLDVVHRVRKRKEPGAR